MGLCNLQIGEKPYGIPYEVQLFSSQFVFLLCYCDWCRACAEQALAGLNGTQLGAQSIRLSWGRSPSNKQVC